MIATAGAIRDSAGGYVFNPLLSNLDVTSFNIITTAGDLELAPVAGSDATYICRRGTAMNLSFFNVTAVSQRSHIADPSGGATVDTEARNAIDAILLAMEQYGLLVSS